MRAYDCETITLDRARNHGQQEIIAATESRKYLRKHPQRSHIRPQLPDRRTRHGADKNDIPTIVFCCKALKARELRHPTPGVLVRCNLGGISPSPQGVEKNLPAT